MLKHGMDLRGIEVYKVYINGGLKSCSYIAPGQGKNPPRSKVFLNNLVICGKNEKSDDLEAWHSWIIGNSRFTKFT